MSAVDSPRADAGVCHQVVGWAELPQCVGRGRHAAPVRHVDGLGGNGTRPLGRGVRQVPQPRDVNVGRDDVTASLEQGQRGGPADPGGRTRHDRQARWLTRTARTLLHRGYPFSAH